MTVAESRERAPRPIRRKNMALAEDVHQGLGKVAEEIGISAINSVIIRFCEIGLFVYEREGVIRLIPREGNLKPVKRFNFAVPEALYQELDKIRKELGMDFTKLVNAFCRQGLVLYERGVTEAAPGVKTIRTEVRGQEIEIIL